ncbi:hypothetical protein [Helicobacter sp. 11S02596-1]|uniref:hypothetical protein n=1 Tax=Helicobacter sp. 11S02596-1 TaxID=1476194 RepID=UPI000BA7C99B|nr:hypothetical protein [Helicobacter sp. 11S02596-1]PAF42356.1 hypothetical protein BJI48_07015 [Helicobacter sp. 11S02596-1]
MKALFLAPLFWASLFSSELSSDISNKIPETFLNTPIHIAKQKIFNMFDSSILQTPKLEIIINQKAKINGKWYQHGQKVSKYHIIAIEQNAVILKNAQQTLKLTTRAHHKKTK